jgi:folate-binding protein YgfZ
MHAPAETRSAGFLSLERYLVGDDAALTDLTGSVGMAGVYGPEAREIVASLWTEPLPPLPERHFTERGYGGDTALVAAAGWTGEEGFEIIASTGALPALWEDLQGRVKARGGLPVGEAALDSLRVEAGTPRGGIDFDAETIPQMAGLDHAISHTKGGYRGQEIVLRVQTKGRVKRSLIGLTLEDPAGSLPGRGTKLRVAGREAGWITSAIASPTLGRALALGYLDREAKAPGTAVELATSPPRRATVSPLPFHRRP